MGVNVDNVYVIISKYQKPINNHFPSTLFLNTVKAHSFVKFVFKPAQHLHISSKIKCVFCFTQQHAFFGSM